jgi:signal peptidase I
MRIQNPARMKDEEKEMNFTGPTVTSIQETEQLKNIVKHIIFWFVTIMLLQGVFHPVVVKGVSMEETYKEGQIRFVNMYAYVGVSPAKGDVIVLYGSKSEYGGYTDITYLLKRVVATEGDEIEAEDGTLFINGVQENAPDGVKGSSGVIPYQRVPEGHVFVMGDNREKSLDSRQVGAISRQYVIGKVW